MQYSEEWLDSVYSDGSKYFVSNPCPKKGEAVKIALQIQENSPVKNVFLCGKKNGIRIDIKMQEAGSKNGLCRYEGEIVIWEDEYSYYFILPTENCIYYYTQDGIKTYIPDEGRNFRILTDYAQPEWIKNAVFYQIFPERFCNGNPEISVKDNEYQFEGHPSIQVKDWNQVPQDYSKVFCLDFYGGDLIGIKQKIPYLKKLGVTALYLNPIFYAATVHKYDCLDYFHVDPHFGGDKALQDLIEELHKNDMKIILDVSINHTGTANRWFNKEGVFFPKSEGAYNNPNSEEREYYFFNADNSYKCWYDVPSLPTLNYQSQKLRNRLYRDKDSVVKKWLKKPYGIDGWRFDVADTMARNDKIQLHHEVWPEIRKSIKEENPEAYILAEDWTDCTSFLNGNEWDSPMNYYISCRAIRSFYGQVDFHNSHVPELNCVHFRWTAKDFSNCVTKYLSRLPFVIQQNLFNLLDSHDISRFHNDKNMKPDFVRGAVILIFTLPGCTNVYYGDEADIDGFTETIEGCRYPMPWNKDIENLSAYKLYSSLCHIKTSSAAFKDGGFKVVSDDNNVFAYARFTSRELWFTVASSDEKERIIELPLRIFGANFAEKPAPETDALGSKLECSVKNGKLNLKVPAGKAFLIKM